MNSPWDPISVGSNSRRSSLNAGQGGSNNSNVDSSSGPGISHHLGRLRKKAQHLQQEQQLQSMTPNALQSENLRGMSGRTSAMSDCSLPASATQLHNTHLQHMQNMQQSYNNNPTAHASSRAQQHQWNNNNMQYPQAQYQQHQQQNGQGPRRASDPVRALDRNFGVTTSNNHPEGELNNRNKSGSFQNISQMNQRVPLHGQRIRGVSGDSHFVNQQMPINGASNQVSLSLSYCR